MSTAAKRARIASVIKLLCVRFPQTFSRRAPKPLKVGVYADVLAALGDTVQPRDLQSALRAYTSNALYLRALTAGTPRIGLDGKPAGTVTPEDEAVAKAREPPRAQVPPPETPAMRPAAKNPTPAPKRLSLADLREAGRRRRGAAA
jgi:sRNA-binding protein